MVWTWTDALFSSYGFMGCPVTMMALGLLILTDPCGNRGLFVVLAVFVCGVGAGMTALGYLPDVGLLVTGFAALSLMIATRLGEGR